MLLAQEPNMDIAGCFTEGAGILRFLKKNHVDVILLDITLPDINGMELCARIKQAYPRTMVLIISNHSEPSIMLQSIKNGASGYLLKNASLQELTQCIHQALQGKPAFSREVDAIIRQHGKQGSGIPRLTKREKQVLHLLGEGKTSQVIAERLFISPFTVDTHRRNLMQKFEVKNVAEMIREAAKHQLI